MENFIWSEKSICALLRDKSDLEQKDRRDWTPLIFASSYGRTDIVKRLIENGANVETVGSEGWTPLMYASHNGYLDNVKLLIEAGANVEAAAIKNWTPLLAAYFKGYLKIFQVLVESGADINCIFSVFDEEDFLSMNSCIKETIEINVYKLTPENLKKWKAYRLKSMFM